MFKDSDAMRVKADDYRQMAEEATDPDERRKFLSYATVYDELAKRRKQEEEQFEGALPHGRRDRPD